MIYVTKTYLPNKEKYKTYVDKIFENGWVTNNGVLVQELEKRLVEYFKVKNVILVANGTLALQIAYQILNIRNIAITTPFSFVATVSSLVANRIKPIFADINPKTFNIEPKNIEKVLTHEVEAIVPVHVFGNPCEIDKIEKISRKNNLKVIYDASHCFGVEYQGKSILKYGDISIISFHATKIFHTIEGGALVTNNDEIADKAKYFRNFGIKNEEEIPYLGINAKMNEFEAAMGLCILDDIDIILENNKRLWNIYKQELGNILELQELNPNLSKFNYSYFPVLFKDEDQLRKVQKALNERHIFPRRYFFPSLDSLIYIEPQQHMPLSRSVSQRILCLPLFYGLSDSWLDIIITTIKKEIR